MTRRIKKKGGKIMKELFKDMEFYGHEEVIFARDEATGLKAIIAIHNTNLGPALGGTRMWNYATEEEAVYDVLRLSRGMSLKNAAAGLNNGGCKTVIMGDPHKLKNREFFHAYGRFINDLGGKMYTAEDVNISTQDVGWIREVTPYVTGTREISGNPSPMTARGTYMGIKAGVKEVFGTDSLDGLTVVVQGLGSVGYGVAEYIHKAGGKLKVFDLNWNVVEKAVKELGATAIAKDEVLTTPCDIFSPCALGAVININNAQHLKCKLVGGCANNVLVDSAAGEALAAKGILYLPDYIINAGGVLNCGTEVPPCKYDQAEVTRKVDNIYHTTEKIIKLSKEKHITTYEAAEEYAWGIINAAGQ
jgi:leucine dehydrogenase